jgi:Ni,Fe-hydrogenase III large subunit
MGVEVSERALDIRVVMAELSSIQSNLIRHGVLSLASACF